VVFATVTTDGDPRRVEVYPDEGGLWRYRVKARNGQIVGSPGQGYARKDGALRAARREHPPAPRIR
jgi:uncharacterized protein YegP (UPF0339 family)